MENQPGREPLPRNRGQVRGEKYNHMRMPRTTHRWSLAASSPGRGNRTPAIDKKGEEIEIDKIKCKLGAERVNTIKWWGGMPLISDIECDIKVLQNIDGLAYTIYSFFLF